ncbi:MAG: hypothetical protein RQ736_14945 [Thiogranum sp.]|nr:hypothetical protein [Thiogranum sp.]
MHANRFFQAACLGILCYPWGSAQGLDVAALEQVAQLARLGAPQLALKRIDAAQPDVQSSPSEWLAWEQERLHILYSQNMYAELVRRVDARPTAIDERFERTAVQLKADAQLELGQSAAARATVRSLLWSTDEEPESSEVQRWRRLIVRSYVTEDRNADAQLALSRYRQDFGDESADWRWLSARVALQAGDAEHCLRLLNDDDSGQGRLLRFAAELQLTPGKAAAIEEAAVQEAKKTDQAGLQRAFWGLAARAAGQAGKPEAEIRYLERALSVVSDQQSIDLQLDLTADRLWALYQALGQNIGNQEQRLLGNDEDWYFPAIDAVTSDPLRARILFAVLAEHGSSAEHRTLAHEYMVALLDDLPQGQILIRRIYLESRRFGSLNDVPQVIRHRLVDDALETGQLHTASRLMDSLEVPPSGADQFEWNLRRVRVNILTGTADAGIELLARLLADKELSWTRERIDRFLQVVFDLQALGRHEPALDVFATLAGKSLEPPQMRELLFWMADSRLALEEYELAAQLYLRSAVHLDPLAMDPWAQTARYEAARALARAGLTSDARRIFTSLQRATQDPARKAVLESEIQRLRLLGDVGAAGG